MSLSTQQYNALIARIEALENTVNILQTVIQKLVTVEQASQLSLLRNQDIESLEDRMDGVETRVSTLENYHKV